MHMVKYFLPIFLLFATVLPGQDDPLPPARSEIGMRAELEAVYEKWRSAMERGDLKAWEASVARYRQVETRNRIVSEKQPFPQALFDSGMQAPTLANLRAMDVLTRRVTASAIYWGKPDFGVEDPSSIRDVFLVLRFLKEDGAWRFDNVRIVRIGDNTDILYQIRNQDFSFLKGIEFQPLDTVPRIQQPAKTPELMAEARVRCFGYESEIWVNGIQLMKIRNDLGKELVMGGVNRGQNMIVIRSKKVPAPEGSPSRFEIAIYAAEGPGKPADRVFHFGPVNTLQPEIQTGFSGRSLK